MGRPKGSLNKSTLKKIAKQEREAEKLSCLKCGRIGLDPEKFYKSASSRMWITTKKRPLFCRECIDSEFRELSDKYGERSAVIAICALLDLPFDPELYQDIINKNNVFLISMYISRLNNKQYAKRSFLTSIIDGSLNISQEEVEQTKEKRWKASERANMDEVLSIIGYDPFEGYSSDDRRFLFSELIKYFDDDIADDPYKLSQIIQIVNNNNQIRRYDYLINTLNPTKNADDIQKLNVMKKDLVANNDKIAKENEISVKNRSNKDIGRSTLTYLMRDLREKDFSDAEANYYSQLTSAGTLWAVEMSNKAIKQNAMFDENDKQEILETQRALIQKLQSELDDEKEKNRILRLNESNGDSNG